MREPQAVGRRFGALSMLRANLKKGIFIKKRDESSPQIYVKNVSSTIKKQKGEYARINAWQTAPRHKLLACSHASLTYILSNYSGIEVLWSLRSG